MTIREISAQFITDTVAQMCSECAFHLPADTLTSLEKAETHESSMLGKSILKQCLQNASWASETQVPLCQDTGTAVFDVKVGADVHITGATLTEAINAGVRKAYIDSYLRKSIVADPLYERINTKDNTPAVIHYDFVPGNQIQIHFAPKGGGAENMSAIRMMVPADGEKGVVDFVLQTVQHAGGNPCPPIVVGIGIGGNFEQCALIAKRALMRPTGTPNSNPKYAALEQKLLALINDLKIGPQGLGGDTTALAVHIETAPSHIASFAVAVNINCHSARHGAITL